MKPCGECGECRVKHRDDKEKQMLLNRLKRVEGQVRGLQSMVERDAYCPDILMQVQAARAALNAFNRTLLTRHIQTCVYQGIREGRDEVISELTDVVERLMK